MQIATRPLREVAFDRVQVDTGDAPVALFGTKFPGHVKDDIVPIGVNEALLAIALSLWAASLSLQG